jgi:hypothetical protein
MNAAGKSLVVLVYCTVGLISSIVGVNLSYGAGAAFFVTGIGAFIAIFGSLLHLISMKYFAHSFFSHIVRFFMIVGMLVGFFFLLFRLGIFDFS